MNFGLKFSLQFENILLPHSRPIVASRLVDLSVDHVLVLLVDKMLGDATLFDQMQARQSDT